MGFLMDEVSFKFDDLDVVFGVRALDTMMSYRQKNFFSKEAGGQLFGNRHRKNWLIDVATGPRRGDKRGRFHFWPDRRAEQAEIDLLYREGLEFLGDWHTHPEDIPRPSNSDITSIENVVRASEHSLPGILLCIVGRLDPPDGFWVSFHRVTP